MLKNVSLRNELLCLGCERNCGARAAEVSRSSYRTELGSVAVLSLSLSHTCRTSDLRVIMARAFPNKSYTNARSFSPYMRASVLGF